VPPSPADSQSMLMGATSTPLPAGVNPPPPSGGGAAPSGPTTGWKNPPAQRTPAERPASLGSGTPPGWAAPSPALTPSGFTPGSQPQAVTPQSTAPTKKKDRSLAIFLIVVGGLVALYGCCEVLSYLVR